MWSEEAKIRNRRRRKARRLYAQMPVFAWEQMKEEYTSPDDFAKDLIFKKTAKRKKNKFFNPANTRIALATYLNRKYLETNNLRYAILADKHLRNRNKPFEVFYKGGTMTIGIKSVRKEFFFELNNKMLTESELDALIEKHKQHSGN